MMPRRRRIQHVGRNQLNAALCYGAAVRERREHCREILQISVAVKRSGGGKERSPYLGAVHIRRIQKFGIV